jgi:fluoride exporter
MKILLLFVAGGLGTLCRYACGKLVAYEEGKFPTATLIINIIGCVIIGILYGLAQKRGINEYTKSILAIGFCGGFTTFSAFGLETLHMLKEQNHAAAVLYIVLSIVLGLAAVFVGMQIAKI